jgi:hypothetical protein
MKFSVTRVKFLRLSWRYAVLLLLLSLMLTSLVSANGPNEGVEWVTICYTPPGHPEDAQTLVVYWSSLDKWLCCFTDTLLGPCP